MGDEENEKNGGRYEGIEDEASGGTSSLSTVAHRPAVPPLACMRYSPRPCVNQDIVDALKPLRDWRFAEYGSGSPEGISYATAISVIIACPYKIRSGEEARALFKVGGKIALRIDEFLETGRVKEADDLAHNSRYQALKSLMTVHGVGHHTAKQLYEQGYRSAEDMRRSGKWEKEFRYHDDIQIPIPRSEVESIERFVKLQLDRIQRGSHIVITGGYRRGKVMSNDVDLLITFPHQDGKERGILRKLCRRLEAKGLIPPDGILSFSEPATLRSIKENKKATSFDSLDKALVVFRHPANGTTRKRDMYRRVDLIISRWPSFGAAVMGWSGSTQFERDLRKHAEKLLQVRLWRTARPRNARSRADHDGEGRLPGAQAEVHPANIPERRPLTAHCSMLWPVIRYEPYGYHANRVTIQPKDIQLARRLRGERQ